MGRPKSKQLALHTRRNIAFLRDGRYNVVRFSRGQNHEYINEKSAGKLCDNDGNRILNGR